LNSFDKTASRIRGIIPALYTPFDRDGNINLKILPKQIEFLSNAGCSGFFVGGSSGEGALQSVRERKMFAEAVIEEVNHRLPVIIHVGAMNPEDSYELAGFSKKMGADAISSIVPYFYNYTVSEVVDYYRKLASAAELPLIVYYMPAIANHNSCLEDFINGILSIPEVIGIKYTDSDLYRLQIIQNITPKSIIVYRSQPAGGTSVRARPPGQYATTRAVAWRASR